MISEILKKLPQDQQKAIREAFDSEVSFMLKLKDGYFLGVHLLPHEDYTIIEQVGVWTYGTLKSGGQIA
jgi:hypothetical protein